MALQSFALALVIYLAHSLWGSSAVATAGMPLFFSGTACARSPLQELRAEMHPGFGFRLVRVGSVRPVGSLNRLQGDRLRLSSGGHLVMVSVWFALSKGIYLARLDFIEYRRSSALQ
jgi:hypothetical protein